VARVLWGALRTLQACASLGLVRWLQVANWLMERVGGKLLLLLLLPDRIFWQVPCRCLVRIRGCS
jgi:hypothetical protein